MNAKTIVPLVVALVLGVVAAKIGRDMLAKNRQGGVSNAKMIKLVVAKEDVGPGSVLTDAQLTLREVPAEGASTYAFTSVADVVGRVVTTQLVKNQSVLETLLAPKGALGGVQAMVPDGYRAVTLEVNEYSGVAGLLTPGCHVDLVQTIHVKGDEGGMMAKTIVENLRVIAVGRRLSHIAPAAAGGGAPEPELAKSVTVLATAEQAEAIDLATHVGQPRLVLRNVLDGKSAGTKGITVAELRGNRQGDTDENKIKEMVAKLLGTGPGTTTKPVANDTPKVEVKPEPKYRAVEVIRGGASTSVRMSLNDKNGTFTGGAEKLEAAVPAER
jgi:pilus assembly protein CpaB